MLLLIAVISLFLLVLLIQAIADAYSLILQSFVEF